MSISDNNSTTSLVLAYDTLSSAILTDSVETIAVTSSTGFSDGDYIKIDDEIILIGTVSGDSFTSCTRGQLGTDPVTHTISTGVYGVFVGSAWDNVRVKSVITTTATSTAGIDIREYYSYNSVGTTVFFDLLNTTASAVQGMSRTYVPKTQYFRLAVINTNAGDNTITVQTLYDNNNKTGNPVLISGTDGTFTRTIKTDADGNIQVDVVSGGTSGTQYDMGDSVGATDTGTLSLVEVTETLPSSSLTNAKYDSLRVNTSGELYVTGAGGGTQYNMRGAPGATNTGTLSLVQIASALPSLTNAEYGSLHVNTSGELYVTSGGARNTTSVIDTAIADGATQTTTHALNGTKISLLIKLPTKDNFDNSTVTISYSSNDSDYFVDDTLAIVSSASGLFTLSRDCCFSHIKVIIINNTGGSINSNVVISDF